MFGVSGSLSLGRSQELDVTRMDSILGTVHLKDNQLVHCMSTYQYVGDFHALKESVSFKRRVSHVYD